MSNLRQQIKIAYDRWQQHAEQYNKLLEEGYQHEVDLLARCDVCQQYPVHIYRYGFHTYCFECAVWPMEVL